MNDGGKTRIVEFWRFCETCKHKDESDAEDPCNECLSNPTNEYSRKPVNYEERSN